jgi:predicted ribosomally synthesized peptide with nif11-like leader
MSVDDLHAFFKKLESDEALRQEVIALDAATDDERLTALRALAGREGFVVVEEDWAHDSVAPAVAALEDEQLRGVVGGAGCPPWAWIGARSAGAYGENGCGESLGAYGGNGCGGSVGAGAASGCG